ncbi:MAG: CRISPR-associated helicase Cas3' [Candidatus Korarchaeum sp.]|nr:CRISPR-associated helicase Cas3' [Candidatus Korarchaeum sp.]MDW8035248.1 CRISPR-associated helicase Cas3' [Candidatus Korarchaeum sp.]
MRVLDEIVDAVRSRLGIELARSDEKESHPGKKLSKHIEECLELSSFILDRFGMGEEAKHFSSLLCELHDVGKLRSEWKLGIKGFKHAEEGAEVLKGLSFSVNLGEKLGLDETSLSVLTFLVRKHHSSLGIDNYKEHKEMKSLNFERATLYADAFGAFKLADFASANGLLEEIKGHLEMEWPDENSLVNLGMDPERLKLQREASKSSMLAAPTGWGKTMVGIIKAINERPSKLFYCLPTITAIRKMKKNFESIFGDSVGEYFYFVDFDLHMKQSEDESSELDIYRFFVPKINLITVDQLLLSMMRAGKYYFRRFQFRNSLVVVDEYHLLPPSMIGALVEVLSRYSALYKMKLLLMTATPLATYKRVLSETLNLSEKDLSSEYSKLRRHRIEFVKEDEALSKVKEMLHEGMRVLVILNRVERAVNFYKKLDACGKVLLHSRFAVKDRYEREGEIDSCRVLVATQVAEVSLDVSFDALVSDAAPVPSIIQRTGRVNRYGKEADRTNVFLIENPEGFEPYLRKEVEESLKVIRDKMEALEDRGELAYLEMLSDYDEAISSYLESEISRSRELIAEKVFEGNQLMSMELSEEGISKNLRGEANVLVVPDIYVEEVKSLLSRLKMASSYSERKRIYSEIKGFLAPLSPEIAKNRAKREDGFPFFVASYNRELGIVV